MPLPHSCSLIANLGQVGPVAAGVLDSRTVFLSSVSGFCWGIIWMRMRSHLYLGSGRGVCCHHFQAYEFSVPFWRVFRFSRLPFKYPICIPWCLQKKHLLSIWDEYPNHDWFLDVFFERMTLDPYVKGGYTINAPKKKTPTGSDHFFSGREAIHPCAKETLIDDTERGHLVP